MSDERLRRLERRWHETGANDDCAAYLVELERTGATLENALLLTKGEAAKVLRTHPVAYVEPKRRLITEYMQQAENRGLQPHHPDYQADYQVPAILHTAYFALDDARQTQHSAQHIDGVLRELKMFRTPAAQHPLVARAKDAASHLLGENTDAALRDISNIEDFNVQSDALGVYLAELSKTHGVLGATSLVEDDRWSDIRVSASIPFMNELLREDRMDDALQLLHYRSRYGGIEYTVARHLAQRGRYAEIPPLLVWQNENTGTVQQLRGFTPCAVYAMMATTLNGRCFDEVSR